MPAQRASRGAYAKYICNHCRKRKIKCILPEHVDIVPSTEVQPAERSCQRCVEKLLECVVDFTILGRPSQPRDSMTRINPAHHGSSGDLTNNQQSEANGLDHIGQDDPESLIDDYLVVQPEKNAESRGNSSPRQQQKLRPADKFQAMTSPAYLLSTLLRRDRVFASRLPKPPLTDDDIIHIIRCDQLPDLDQRLVWHRLCYPDVPTIIALHQELSNFDQQDPEYLPIAYLYSLLCLLALETPGSILRSSDISKVQLAALVIQLAQRTIFIVPRHRHAMLALELMAEYRPLTLATNKPLASDALLSRMISPLLKDIASGLDLQSAPSRLKQQLHQSATELNVEMLHDCLKWYRLCLNDSAMSAQDRNSEKKHMMGDSAIEIMELLETLLHSNRLPPKMLSAFHSLLCQATKIEYLLKIKEDWRNLTNLGNAIDNHKIACEWQQKHLKLAIQSSSALSSGQALAMTQLLDMQLHSSYCWVSGSATFYCVMAGGQAQHYNTDNHNLNAEQALAVSDRIIERFAETTSHLHASEPHTTFLIKYGSKRMDDLELALLNFISAIDNPRLEGIPYIPPTKHTTSHILYTVKDVMEGQAARMKGWGGLHERAHMHLLLIRDCAASLERVGSSITGETGAQAISKGCLWAATARLLRSLHKLLAEWKEWNTLGQAKISIPSRSSFRDDAVQGEDSTMLDDLDDFLADDMFFDWNLWLNEGNTAVPFE